jgi:hypothetical protein
MHRRTFFKLAASALVGLVVSRKSELPERRPTYVTGFDAGDPKGDRAAITMTQMAMLDPPELTQQQIQNRRWVVARAREIGHGHVTIDSLRSARLQWSQVAKARLLREHASIVPHG